MSTPASAPPPVPPAPSGVVTSSEQEIRIVSHSSLFYWWPVWTVGTLMAALTFVDSHRLILVPGPLGFGDIEDYVEVDRRLQIVTGSDDPVTGRPPTSTREGLTLKKGHLLPEKFDNPASPPRAALPKLRMAASSSYGVIFATVLLLVIVITNVPLRGLWSVIVIVSAVLVVVIFALLDWWTPILDALYLLDIRINMAGYLFISIILFAVWLVSVMLFDRQIYMLFTPGQLKVCLEVGGGETAYDTMGMSIEKHRDDLFRHWVLGLGSGDLTVKTSGATAHTFHLPNVLFVGRKLQMIEEMQRERPVVRG